METNLMMKTSNLLLLTLSILFLPVKNSGQDGFVLEENFNTNKALNIVGKGDCYVIDGKLINREAYATFGEANWENYRLSFEARTPEWEEQVQIWFSF